MLFCVVVGLLARYENRIMHKVVFTIPRFGRSMLPNFKESSAKIGVPFVTFRFSFCERDGLL